MKWEGSDPCRAVGWRGCQQWEALRVWVCRVQGAQEQMTPRLWGCFCLRRPLEMGIFGGETNLREEDTFNFGCGGCGVPVEQRSPTFLS